MKKELLFWGVGSLLFGISAQAQLASYPQKALAKDKFPTVIPSTAPVYVDANRAMIYQDDFSVPANWAFSNTGSPSANWSIGTAAPTGSYSSGMGAIASTSGGNFALFDSDALGSGSSSQNAVLSLVAPIDLTGHPAVWIEFESYYRAFNGTQCFLEVSTDNSTWTQFQLHTDIPSNSATPNPATVSINPGTAFGNAATFYIRFRYIGEWDYAWMLDDIKISDAPTNEMVLTEVSYGKYTKYPVGQERPLTLYGRVLNNGGAAQTNVTLEVKENGTTIGTSPAVASIPVLGTDSLTATTTHVFSGVGPKVLAFNLNQTQTDSIPANNTMTRNLALTEHEFSRDNNVYTGSGYANLLIGTNQDRVTGCGVAYTMTSAAKITGVNVVLASATNAGAEMKAEIFDASGPELQSLGESDIYQISATEINTAATTSPVSVRLDFFSPVDLAANGYYFVAVWQESDTVSVAYNAFNRDGDDALIFSGGDWGGLIGGTYVPYIRMNLNDDNTSIKENDLLSAVAVFPNPTSDLLNVTFSEIKGDVVLQLFSVEGKQVLSRNANVVAGQNLTLDVAGLASGVYSLRVTSDKGTVSKQVVIK